LGGFGSGSFEKLWEGSGEALGSSGRFWETIGHSGRLGAITLNKNKWTHTPLLPPGPIQ